MAVDVLIYYHVIDKHQALSRSGKQHFRIYKTTHNEAGAC